MAIHSPIDLHLISSAIRIYSRDTMFLLFVIEDVPWQSSWADLLIHRMLEHLASVPVSISCSRASVRDETEKGSGQALRILLISWWHRQSGCLCNVCLWQIRATGVLKLQQQRESICFTNFITLIQNVHKLLPKRCYLPSTANVSGGRKLIININYQGPTFVSRQK